MTYGIYHDDIRIGQVFRHWPGRTISEFDDTLFSLMSMNQHPLHIDEAYASRTPHGQRLVVGPLVISIVIGLTQADIGSRALEVLEYIDVQHTGPVFHGDTIYAESTIIEKDGRMVTLESRGLNQRGEVVLTLKRKFVQEKRT